MVEAAHVLGRVDLLVVAMAGLNPLVLSLGSLLIESRKNREKRFLWLFLLVFFFSTALATELNKKSLKNHRFFRLLMVGVAGLITKPYMY